jgi:lysylphosphatidylglycerol synthetase-like protein (DUF2156 family)
LIRAPLSTTAVLDEAADAVRLTAAPWGGLLIITALPYRFAQAIFADRLLELGGDAVHYGNYLGSLASLTMMAFVVSRFGRLVFARAVRLAGENGSTPGREAWHIPPASFFNYIYTSAVAELISIATLITCVAPLLCTMLSGLAIGTAELNDQPSLAAPIRRIGRCSRDLKIVAAMVLVFGCAFFVAALNILAAFAIGMWLASSIGGWDLHRWTILMSFENHRFVVMLIAGAVLALEPFWIAAHVTLVRKAGAAESGDDLRAWFEELRNA